MRAKLFKAGLALAFLGLALFPVSGEAQGGGETLTLHLRRTFGFSAGGRIQGRFTVTAAGPQDLTEVTFTLDGNPIGSVSQAPFSLAFSTGDYPLGAHALSASGRTSAGVTLEAQPLQLEFISAESSASSALKIAGPIVVGALVLILISAIVPGIGRRNRKFELGSYGAAGGAVCPRCGMPYSRSVLAPNLVLGKLERCPHCGKWAVVSRASQAQLDAAEARYRQDAQQGEVDPDQHERRYERMIDDSRFED
jgi:hypothetical protein